MVLLSAAFYARPSWHIPVWSTIGVTGAVAVIVGVVRNKPRHRAPWVLLAISLVSFAAGDTTYNLLTSIGHEVNPFPSPADLFYLVTCVTQVAGVYGLVRAATAVRDRSALIDSLVLASGIGVVYWIILIGPRVHAPDLTPIEKVISVAYPLTDVVLLALVARLVVSVRRTPSVMLLTVGIAGLLQSDVVYGLSQLNANWHIGGPVDIGWIVLYAAVGAAALHPSMVTLTAPRAVRSAQMGRSRMVLLVVSALIAPAALIVETSHDRFADAAVIAAVSAAVFLLVMVRLADVLRSNRRALDRERALRHAGDAMVSAADTAGVRAALSAAIRRMIPGPTRFHVDVVRDLAAGRDAADRQSRDADLSFTSAFGPELPDGFRDFELAYVCAVPAAPGTGQPPSSVVLAADERTLSVMKAPVDVLTAQATLALARIGLTDEVNRRKSEEYFRTLVQNTSDVILIVEDGTVRYASPSAVSVFGYQEVVGQTLDNLVTADEHEPGQGLIEQMRRRALSPGGGEDDGVDWTVRRPDGQVVHVEVSTRDLTEDPTVRGVVVTLRDVTDRRRMEWQLTHHAYHDPLTGAANRLLFQERVNAALDRTDADGSTVGVLFIDLDDFKITNDTMGHHAGDELLIAVARRLGAELSPHSVARLGGDEFAALIEDVSDPAAVEAVAEQLVTAFDEPFQIRDVPVSGAVSIGVATTAEAEDTADLLREADLALYVAKGDGKGRWRRYEPELHTAVLNRMRIRTEIDQAINDDSFELNYQPIMGLDEGRPVGFEALVRWVHPQAGVMAPGEFIEIAEESGQIVALGDWVMRTAIHTAAGWHDPSLYVSVNVSVRQFRTPGFVEAVRGHLGAAGMPPSRLMLEITESMLLPDEQQVWDDLYTLREMGVRIAIDDFGTGYSSLSYLRRVPVDVVKIDRSFVETVSTSSQQRELVRGIVWLAVTLGLSVIAEGIETPAERSVLLELGCPYGQGYLFSAPMSREASLDWQVADPLPV